MKKLLALALVALLGSTAHAVSVDWSKVDLVSGASVTQVATNATSAAGSGTLSVSTASSWTVVMDATITNVSTNTGAFVWLFSATAGDATLGLRTNTTTTLLMTNQATTGTSEQVVYSWGAGTLSTGTHEYALSYDGTTVSFYVDGVLTASTSAVDFSGSDVTYSYGQNASGSSALSGRITYTADVYAVTGATYATLIQTTAPEPTALALLALGVAGIALKRRTA